LLFLPFCGRIDRMNKTVLQAVTGSRAYGLNHAQSDIDKMSVFVAPTVQVAGLNWASKHESWSDAGPEGDDNTGHEIGKFLRLTLKSNPTLIELYFMDDYEILDEVGQGMIDIRDAVLYTDGIRHAYYNYALSQLRRVEAEYPDHKPKMARHCLRIARQGIEILETGNLTVRVPDPDEYFELDNLSFIYLIDKLDVAVANIMLAKSILPDEPNRDKVAEFLEDVRRTNIG
jgi:uncharacterized protein